MNLNFAWDQKVLCSKKAERKDEEIYSPIAVDGDKRDIHGFASNVLHIQAAS